MNTNTKITQDQIQKVIKMPVKILFRNSIKLLRTYPSKNRDKIREDLILDYKDGAKLTNAQDIEKALEYARKGLIHIMAYNLIRNELIYGDTSNIYIDATSPIPAGKVNEKKNAAEVEKLQKIINKSNEVSKKNKSEKFDYFT